MKNDLADAAGPAPERRQHVYYKTIDGDAPDYLCDRNGEVVLAMCRICGQAESELSKECPGGER